MMTKFNELSKTEVLEIIESLIEISARKEAEIAELKAQLDIYKPKDFHPRIIEKSGNGARGDILLVFQSGNLRDILKTMFDRVGSFRVAAVERYDESVAFCATNHPDICIFEISNITNIESQLTIMKEMKLMIRNFSLISILPENDISLIREVVAAGSDDFLVKPIDMHRLVGVISDILSKRLVGVGVGV